MCDWLSALVFQVLVLEEERNNYSFYLLSAILAFTSLYVIFLSPSMKVIALVITHSEAMPYCDYFCSLSSQPFLILWCLFWNEDNT